MFNNEFDGQVGMQRATATPLPNSVQMGWELCCESQQRRGTQIVLTKALGLNMGILYGTHCDTWVRQKSVRENSREVATINKSIKLCTNIINDHRPDEGSKSYTELGSSSLSLAMGSIFNILHHSFLESWLRQ